MSPERSFTLVYTLFILSSCQNDWRTDLWYQPSLRAEAAPRPEPAHAVPLGARPQLLDRDDAINLVDPVPKDATSLSRAEPMFLARCACCHGKEGHGGGPVSKKFPPAPDLAYSAIRARSDGFLYATIQMGGRAMPAQGEGLDARDSWDLVNYVRHVQSAAPSPAAPTAAQGVSP